MQITPDTSIIAIWAIVKIFFIIGLSVYLIFALVVVRQIQIMNKTVRLHLELLIISIGYLHLLFALFLLIFAIFAL